MLLTFCGAAAKLRARVTVEVPRSHTVRHAHKHTLGRTVPIERPADHKRRYLDNTHKKTHRTNDSALLGVRTRDSSNETAAKTYNSDRTASTFDVVTQHSLTAPVLTN